MLPSEAELSNMGTSVESVSCLASAALSYPPFKMWIFESSDFARCNVNETVSISGDCLSRAPSEGCQFRSM